MGQKSSGLVPLCQLISGWPESGWKWTVGWPSTLCVTYCDQTLYNTKDGNLSHQCHQEFQYPRKMITLKLKLHPHVVLNCSRWFVTFSVESVGHLYTTIIWERMGKISASLRIGFRMTKNGRPCDTWATGYNRTEILFTYWSNFANLNDNALRSFSSSVTITGWP